MREAAKAFVATGLQPGDRASMWAPNIHQWIVAALGLYAAGGVLVPLNTRFKGTEAAHVLRTSGARFLFTVTDFLDTELRRAARRRRRARPGRGDRDPRGPVPDGTVSWADFLARGADGRPTPRSRRARRRSPATRCATSSSPRAPPARRRARCCATAPACALYDAWSDVVGLRHGDRYLLVYPFFHTAGLKSGLLASLLKGATLLPHLVFDPPPVMATGAGGADHDAAGAAGDLPDHPQHRRQRVRPVVAAPGGHRRRGRARSSWWCSCASELGFETVVTGYGLTETTGIVDHVPPRRRPRDHRPHVGPADPRHRGEDRRRRRQRAARPASRARSSSAATT